VTIASILRGQSHGVFRWTSGTKAGPAQRLEGQVERAGWRFVLLDTEGATDKAEFLERCAEAFDLPSWFGRNWDALDECLRGLDLDEPTGLLVVWDQWADLADGDPDAFDTAIEVFRDACVAWNDDEVPGAVLLRGAGPETDLPEL